MPMKQLLEKREAAFQAAKALEASPAGEDGDLSDEQQARFDDLLLEYEKFDKRIKQQERYDAAERRMTGETISGENKDFVDARRRCSLQKAIAYQIDPRSVDAGREIEVSKEYANRAGRPVEGIMLPLEALGVEQRVLTKTGDGSNLIQTELLDGEHIDVLRAASVAVGLGALVMPGMHGDIALPKMDARTPAAAWFPEDNALTPGDHSFSQVTGSPNHLGLLTEYSRKLILQTSTAVERIVRGDINAKLGAGVDLAVMKGSGASGQPEGITNTTGINTKDSSSASPTWADVVGVSATVEAADVPQAALGWAMNAHAKKKMRTTVKVAGEANFLMNDATMMDGYPVATSSQLVGDPAASPVVDGEVIFGAWNQVIVAFWSGVEILVNPFESTAYSKGNVQVRGIVDADVLIRHPEAFLHWQNIQVT